MQWAPVDLAFSCLTDCSPLTYAYSRSFLGILCAIVGQGCREPALRLRHYQTADKMLTKKTLESKRETAGAILAEQSSSGDVRQSFWVAAKSHNMVTKIVLHGQFASLYKTKKALQDLVEHKKSSFHIPLYVSAFEYLCLSFISLSSRKS